MISNSSNFSYFDKSQAVKHLSALGYGSLDDIFLRYINPVTKTAHTKQGAKSLNVKEIEAYQRQGYNVYFVVNGQGNDDAPVKLGRCIFYEHDDLDKELQLNLWQTLGLPEPTIQINTQGRSIHSYWTLDYRIDIGSWRQLQEDLLKFANGDTTIRNPSRVMRLAGSTYFAKDGTRGEKATIVGGCEKTYTEAYLRKLIPRATPPTPLLNYQPAIAGDVPLYQCLSKEDRVLIDNGAASDRNVNGARLARSIIGAAARLTYLGYRYEGDPCQMFMDFCNRCNQGDGWNQREWDSIWKSAQKDNPSATLTDDAIENCIKAWQRNQQKANKRMVQVTKAAGTASNVVPHPTAERLTMDDDDIAIAIENLIVQALPTSKLQLAIATLAKVANRSDKTIAEAYRLRLAEIEQIENRGEAALDVEALIDSNTSKIDINSVIPENLANPILKVASLLNLRPEMYLSLMLTVASTLHKVGTKLILHEMMEFEVTPNLFMAIVAESSQKKSPAIKTMVTKPLSILQQKAREEFREAQDKYEEDCHRYENLKGEERREAFPDGKPQPPKMKRYYFSNTTNEGLINQAQAHPQQGILANVDELAGLLKSANAYRQGRGSDEEDLLSYYDGTGSSVLRADGMRADLDGLLLGISGSIQPNVIQELMRDCSDGNGKWARFCFVNQQLSASTMPVDGGSLCITPMLADLYEKIDKLPPTTYRLSKESQAYYRKVYNRLEQKRISDPSQAMRAVWGKTEGRIGKLAINLHVINAIAKGESPSEVIAKETLVAASNLANFYASQVKALYMEFEDPQALAPMLAKVIQTSNRKGGWIRACDVCEAITKKQRPSPDKVRGWFTELAAMGKGVVRGSGRSLDFSALEIIQNSKSDKIGQKSDKMSYAESLDKYEVQSLSDKSDKSDDFGKNQKDEKLSDQSLEDMDCKTEEKNQNLSDLSDLSDLGYKSECEPVSASDNLSDNLSDLSDFESDLAIAPAATAPAPDELAEEATKLKVSDRVKVYRPGHKTHGLEGIILEFKVWEPCPYLVGLEAQAGAETLMQYRVKEEWIERLGN